MINWLKFRYLYLAFSLLIIIPGAISLARFGLKLSIDFTGGSVLTLSDSTIIRQKDMTQQQADEMVGKLKEKNKDLKMVSFETLGPSLGQETIKKTIYAVLLASLLILIHITRAFKQLKFGVCALLAMLHDSLVLLGIFSLLGHFFGIEVDLLFVTATLTVLSFSVHDTIVVYDRIRELQKRHSNESVYELANQAVSETMIRSLNNSLTIIFMLLALFLLGGASTRFFALALLIGTISGSYSSPFTAVPLLVIWDDLRKSRGRTSSVGELFRSLVFVGGNIFLDESFVDGVEFHQPTPGGDRYLGLIARARRDDNAAGIFPADLPQYFDGLFINIFVGRSCLGSWFHSSG